MLPTQPIQCPYCGESIELVIDDSVDEQEYIDDCSVCCRPINVSISVSVDGGLDVAVWAENEA